MGAFYFLRTKGIRRFKRNDGMHHGRYGTSDEQRTEDGANATCEREGKEGTPCHLSIESDGRRCELIPYHIMLSQLYLSTILQPNQPTHANCEANCKQTDEQATSQTTATPIVHYHAQHLMIRYDRWYREQKNGTMSVARKRKIPLEYSTYNTVQCTHYANPVYGVVRYKYIP